ncbi:MAG: right-handed parallel beta-helix repeat-containing protein [Chitinophagaceae bacterium]
MTKKILTVLVLLPVLLWAQPREMALTKSMVIKKSVKIKKTTYKLSASENLALPVIRITGNNVIVDFNNAALQGIHSPLQPDKFTGVAIIVENGKNITIKNLSAKGYKIAVLAKNVQGLTIENCDFSYNYRPHLNSTREKEDISDWMSYHQNEKDEWLRYGAAMYLRNCNNATVRNCKVTGGQNALMMVESSDGMIYNNDFSFNSGIGLGMYRCNRNKVLYNKINFNVRGYSHGVYNRGQDSAGILVYEQSNNNLFYRNSVTHGGDGFFLWAGQTTMNTGQGGCNDNILLRNDFSYAPTNGIEVTFSRNIITGNRIFECDHGIWGGYSFNTKFNDNQFRNNRIAIAIEHGQENNIHHNLFYADKEAIKLWARKEQPADWGYAKHRDTRSRDYAIVSNSFNNIPVVFNLNRTITLNIFNNIFTECDKIFKTDSTVLDLDTTYNERIYNSIIDTTYDIPEIKNPVDPFKGGGKLAGRKNILITDWGPYDFRYPIIWNTNPTDTSDIMQFELKGPKGKWKVVSSKGVTDISATSGNFPATITTTKTDSITTDISIQLQYVGEPITTPFGQRVSAGKPYTFYFKKFFQPIDWQVKWYAFDSVSNPVKETNNLLRIQKQNHFKTEAVKKLDYAWWGGIKADKQYQQFVTVANGTANIPTGTYELGVTWDDAVRIYVDDKLIIDEWNPSLYKFDESPHKKVKLKLSGNHNFTVEHVELGGFATLSLKMNRLN